MSGNHLTVPEPTFTSITGGRDDEGPTGRPRSGSNRSTASQRSRNSQTSGAEFRDVDYSRQPTIRISRQPSRANIQTPDQGGDRHGGYFGFNPLAGVRRNRSNSEPTNRLTTGTEDVATPRLRRPSNYMPEIQEVTSIASDDEQQDSIQPIRPTTPEGQRRNAPRLRHARTNIHDRNQDNGENEYESQVVDLLDLVDPEVSTLTTLTNVQNSLFVPDLGRYLNRRPAYTLTPRATDGRSVAGVAAGEDEELGRFQTAPARPQADRAATTATLNTITSRVQDKFYAVLPHGVKLEGWSEEEKLELNDHVRHMLHSRRSKFKRGLRGFGKYVSKPLGFFVTLYAVLITLFGLAWVLFLIGWINVGDRKTYIVHVIDSVLVALFAIVGDGLAPFRAVDTYHMCFIAHYHHLTWRLRRERSLPKLQNRSDLPGLPPSDISELEKQEEPKSEEYSVLTPEQQRKLEHHQKKFSKSHSFYKPHETATHNAFSLRLLVAVVVLLDCHSLLQISLGATTWGISYKIRPFAITTVILCCSITCNVTAGILISIGDKRSRKKDVIERMERQQLTEEAMRLVEKKRTKDLQEQAERRGLSSADELREQMSLPPPVVVRSATDELGR